jgi:hypothetical protein
MYTLQDIVEYKTGIWSGNNPNPWVIDGDSYQQHLLITFKNGKICNADTIEGAIKWMNELDNIKPF